MRLTVIVCTRDRPELLRGCLAALRGLGREDVSFLVVDNAACDQATREVVEAVAAADPRFAYLEELRPGLSRARNAGLRTTDADLVAFIDDDVRPPVDWLEGILAGFRRRADVACVTGPLVSASLEYAAERYFDQRIWWSASAGPRLFDREHAAGSAVLHPYAAGRFGTGANMAFKADMLRAIGGFDEALGAGTRTRGGEDLDVFVRIIRAGYAIAHEPAAVALHQHRVELADLRAQMHAYGRGLSAYLFKYMCSPTTTLDLLRRMPDGIRHLGVLSGRAEDARRTSGAPRGLWRAEVHGLAAGPASYIRERREQDRSNRMAVAP